MALIDRKTFADLANFKFLIPSQQRGYKWTEENVTILLEDLVAFRENAQDKEYYCMQPLALAKAGDNTYEVLDGQQRLTTFYLINKALENEEAYIFEFERDDTQDEQEVNRASFLRGEVNEVDDSSIDLYYISNAYISILNWLNNHEAEKENLKNLLNGTKEDVSVQFIWYEISEEDNKHEIFRNLNSGKIPLTNAELIKALLVTDSSVQNKELAVAQYTEMEIGLNENRFWSMLQATEAQKRRSRLDLLFNLALDINEDAYQKDAFCAFNKFMDRGNGKSVSENWTEVRKVYTRLRDLYDNPYCYHYIGFLTYCKKDKQTLKEILNERNHRTTNDFINWLRGKIKQIWRKPLREYYYGDSPRVLRQLFVLHNVETILSRYRMMEDKLQITYEQFPFDLLYSQSWDIEHISSQTDNPLTNEVDWKDWIDSTSKDFKEVFEKKEIKDKYDEYKIKASLENFKSLYEAVVRKLDDDLKAEKIENKDGIGNLVLLDSSTNRSYQNHLYPRKRSIIIMADGNQNTADGNGVKIAYVPICTKQVFMKFYNKNTNIQMNAWTKSDFEAYERDMQEKLGFYFSKKEIIK